MQPTVIVVGGGLAGLSAAIRASQSGAHVTVFEKEANVGGNSAKATSGMNACGTPAQEHAGIHDSLQSFFGDTLESGHGLSDMALVRTLVSRSADAVAWLKSEAGVDLASVCICGGHSVPRTHQEAPRADGKPTPVGWDIVKAMKARAETLPNITFKTGWRVTALLQDTTMLQPGKARGSCPVIGVKALKPAAAGAPGAGAEPAGELVDVYADAVVLATGGYAAATAPGALLGEFAPQLATLPTTNGAFATGDGVTIARAAGAALVHMNQVQVHPTGLVDPKDPTAATKFLGAEALRGVGGILLNHKGQRFVNELGRRDEVVAAMSKYCALPGEAHALANVGDTEAASDVTPRPVHAFLVLTESAAKAFGPNFAFYHKVKGFFKTVEGAAGLAAEIGASASAETISAAFEEYSRAAAGISADRFGKRAFPDRLDGASTATLYVALVTPSIHYCMGGVAFNSAAEVCFEDNYNEVAAASDTGVIGVPASSPLADYVGVKSPAISIADSASPASPAAPAKMLIATRSSGNVKDLHDPADDLVGLDATVSAEERVILRPIPRLFAAGEVTGGLHGGNRLAGNSLLECVVLGRIAGERAAAVSKVSTRALLSDVWTPLTFRESFKVAHHVYLFRFNLPSPLHTLVADAAMGVGQYVAVRACPGTPSGVPVAAPPTADGAAASSATTPAPAEIVRYYSPISRPDAPGILDLLLKVDAMGGPMTTHFNTLQPGDTIDVRGPLGTLSLDFRKTAIPGIGTVRKLGLIAGGTGISPMCQILRSIFYHERDDIEVTLLYGAAAPDQFAYLELLRRKARIHRNFKLELTVDKVPPGAEWHGRVGFITASMLKAVLAPPGEDVFIVVCGPPPMCKAVKGALAECGYTPAMYHSYM